MDSPASSFAVSVPVEVEEKERDGPFASVDPFLVEALQNPRYRITVLRMELDIQRFIQNPELQQFEFQKFPTSFLKCIAHRVAQHYGLQTSSSEKLDKNGWKSIVVAKKTSDTWTLPFSLSEIPPVPSEMEGNREEIVGENKKIVILPRQGGGVGRILSGLERKERSELERKEEYEKARARIFEGNGEEEEKGPAISTGEEEKIVTGEDHVLLDKSVTGENCTGSRVAIFKDHFKDRSDPDFDRRRYSAMGPQIGVQPQLLQYGAISPYMMMPNLQFAYGYNQMDSNFAQYPSPSKMYNQMGMIMFQGLAYPQYQQPLRF